MSTRSIRRWLLTSALPAAAGVAACLPVSPARAQFPDLLSASECAGCAEHAPGASAGAAAARRFAGTWSSALTSSDDPAWALEDFFCLVACTPEERAAATAVLENPANAHRPTFDLFPPAVRRIKFACDPSGFVSQVLSPLPLQIEQEPGRFVLHYEQFNADRTVLLHGNHDPRAHQPSRFGVSKARLENGGLVVETSRIPAAPHYDTFGGGPHSGELLATERYTTSDDGSWLFLELTLEDPETLGEPLVLMKTWRRVPNVEILRYSCDVMSGQLEGVVAEYFDPKKLDARRN